MRVACIVLQRPSFDSKHSGLLNGAIKTGKAFKIANVFTTSSAMAADLDGTAYDFFLRQTREQILYHLVSLLTC